MGLLARLSRVCTVCCMGIVAGAAWTRWLCGKKKKCVCVCVCVCVFLPLHGIHMLHTGLTWVVLR